MPFPWGVTKEKVRLIRKPAGCSKEIPIIAAIFFDEIKLKEIWIIKKELLARNQLAVFSSGWAQIKGLRIHLSSYEKINLAVWCLPRTSLREKEERQYFWKDETRREFSR